MNEQSTVTANAAPQKKRSLVHLYLTLMVVYGAIAGISAYGFYYNYQDGGVGILLAVAAAVTVAATLLYVLPYKLPTFVQIVLAVLLPYVNLVLLEWFTHNPWETMSLGAFALNLPFYYFLMLFIFLLTGRLRLALVLETIFSLIVGLANYFVILFRSAPILPWDLYSIRVASSVAGNFTYSISYQVVYVLFAFVLVFLIESRITLRWKKRTPRLLSLLPLGALAAGYLAVIWIPNLEDYFDIDNTLFTPGYMYRTNGFMTAFLMDTRYLHVSAPDGYSPETAKTLLTEAASEASDPEETHTPNVIVIMDEAFSDPAVLGDFAVSMDYMPFVRSLKGAENTVTGYMYASVLGGNTANTEFEFLTGNSMAFLPAGSIPYQQYLFDTTENLTDIFNALGYETVAMHPYNSTGWNRNKVYQYFGFDAMHFVADFQGGERLRKYISDACLFDRIIQLYEEKEEGTPLFSFNVTMQNHSGYSDDYNNNLQVDVTADEINSHYLNNYLSLMKYTDAALQDLIEYFSQAEEDTILVFFGDHQPNDYVVKGIYKRNGVDYDSLPFAEQEKRYMVPLVIWANFDIEEETDVEISANYIANLLFEKAGLPMSDYQKFLETIRQDIPVLTATMYEDTAGTIHPVNETDRVAEIIQKYQIVQYHRLFAKDQ
ncbi:MAG: sulfatase-like hydrolase/transferase [Lachnospiraceae bacterium]|nr:sulfatase-like hydrolase/transferase [Lachnospiraceae bacterium]